MARICSVCGKGKMSGNKVSHSKRRMPTNWSANLQKVRVQHEDGSVSNEYVCTRCLRSGKVERV